MKSGNYACAEGAIAAGCRFYVGNSVTSSSEIAEHMAKRLPQVGGHYLQMEDEIGSIAAILGASKGGLKSMTVISRPNLSATICENIALAVMTETPCVLVNIQCTGTGSSLSSLVGHGENTTAKLTFQGSDQTIAYAPNSVQEMFDLTVKAFNMAEKYHRPTFVMADQMVVNMTDTLVIPAPEKLEIVQRRKPARRRPNFSPTQFIEDLPPIALARKGLHVKEDNLTSDRRRNLFTDRSQIRKRIDQILEVEHYLTEDAKAVVVAYGSTSRSALLAVKEARRAKKKVGLLRLITPWPFPGKEIEQLSAEKIIVPDIDDGQMERLVREHTSCPVIGIHHEAGTSFPPDEIYKALDEE